MKQAGALKSRIGFGTLGGAGREAGQGQARVGVRAGDRGGRFARRQGRRPRAAQKQIFVKSRDRAARKCAEKKGSRGPTQVRHDHVGRQPLLLAPRAARAAAGGALDHLRTCVRVEGEGNEKGAGAEVAAPQAPCSQRRPPRSEPLQRRHRQADKPGPAPLAHRRHERAHRAALGRPLGAGLGRSAGLALDIHAAAVRGRRGRRLGCVLAGGAGGALRVTGRGRGAAQGRADFNGAAAARGGGEAAGRPPVAPRYPSPYVRPPPCVCQGGRHLLGLECAHLAEPRLVGPRPRAPLLKVHGHQARVARVVPAAAGEGRK